MSSRSGGGGGGGGGVTNVVNVVPFAKNLSIECILLEKGPTTETADGHRVCTCLVADATASMTMSLWDRQIDALEVADILSVQGGSTALYKDALSFYVGPTGTIKRTGTFTKLFTESPNISQWTWTKDPSTKAFVRAT
ncbi:unnamed protein product (mitochondrion) [Plasmodiophora brassicae]|uniref:Single-stranded DNA binding protein Ssb-like OB fold domain-containing protein n=1 Tax=Plasmodiophora brassicae TaxID=37360 RepID=A0A0G4IKE6_PLABS|nr:hypothetical protein PBRA_004384 [Plasmodiophora brassicae]SPR00528.1 unnamed protein product [Plasmodiophora brassicae]